MCGLGFILASRPAPALHATVSAMADLIQHRGPDDRQVVILGPDGAPTRGPGTLGLAFTRLAIQDLSDAGRQPMTDPSRRFWLVFNGEIYNFPELRAELEATGETFVSAGDTEVLLRLLASMGADALPRLDGMFGLVLVDTVERRVLIARDRFGIKPLYRWRAPDSGDVLLASEIKVFTAHPEWRARLNGPRAADFLRRGIIDHTSETMFAGVTAVPAGHVLAAPLEPDAIARAEPRRWYEPGPAAVDEPRADWPASCRRRLYAAIERRMRADVPVGTCLSGGLDSSSIVTGVAELRAADGRPGPVAITARSEDATIDEGRFAHAVAEATGSTSRDVTLSPHELFDRLDDLVWIHDEPFATPSIYAQFRVFEDAACAGVTVMLDGQGADEQFAGYHDFFPVRLGTLLRGGRLLAAHRFAHSVADLHGISAFGLAARALALSLPASVRGRLRRTAVDRTLALDDLTDDPHDPFDRMTGAARGLVPFSLDLLSMGSLPMLLHWEDRNSMAHSIEARVPFLSHDLVGWTLGLPDDAKLDGGVTKAVLRAAMKDRLPERVRTRTDKIAFATPEATWLGGAHASRVGPRLERAFTTCGDVVTDAGRARLRAISRGERPYDGLLWRVLCFAAWRERFGVE